MSHSRVDTALFPV